MEWNVYRYDVNHKRIEVFNIFDHYSFCEEVTSLLKKKYDKERLSAELKHIAMYYFWRKCENEVIVTSWPSYIERKELNRLKSEQQNYNGLCYNVNLETKLKIDIYQQLCLNWDRFVDYVYSFSK